MILIKLGGSIITNKQKPLSPRKAAMRSIMRPLKDTGEPVILVHGGGSFGHYWSVKYDMHTKPDDYDLRGVATVKNSMVSLNKLVLDAALEEGLNVYAMPPSYFVDGTRAAPSRTKKLAEMASSGLIPVTFGDAMWLCDTLSYILSGDVIMGMLARALRPRLCIFAMNTDGLYEDADSKKLITIVENQRPTIAKTPMDVTGGMRRKLDEALKISRSGMDVFFVNGNRPERMSDAILGSKFNGTLFRGKKR